MSAPALVSRLTIQSAIAADSGNYRYNNKYCQTITSATCSCVPSYATPSWVMVHIVIEEEPAGLQLSEPADTAAAARQRLLPTWWE